MDQQVFDTEKGRTTNLSTLNIALIVIIVILGLATVALGFGYFSQQNEIRSLTEENIDLFQALIPLTMLCSPLTYMTTKMF